MFSDFITPMGNMLAWWINYSMTFSESYYFISNYKYKITKNMTTFNNFCKQREVCRHLFRLLIPKWFHQKWTYYYFKANLMINWHYASLMIQPIRIISGHKTRYLSNSHECQHFAAYLYRHKQAALIFHIWQMRQK